MMLLENGAVGMSRAELSSLLEYSTTLPTGTTPGKMWKCRRPYWSNNDADWWRGAYGRPYPEGHEYHGQIPIIWQHIVILGAPAAWPTMVRVPPLPRPGPVAAPLGRDDGEQCLRDNGRGSFCLSHIQYLPDAALGGCGCSHSPMPPCSYCVSTLPECPGCGWRLEE